MKSFLRIVLLLGIVFVSPFTFLFAAMRMAPYSAPTIKQTIADSGVYDSAVKQLQEAISASHEEGSADDPLTLVGPFLQKEITPTYLKLKADTFIDNMRAWSLGQTKTPPVISFSDLKEKLVRQNANIIDQLQSMSEEFKKQKAEVASQQADSAQEFGSADTANMPDFDMNKILQTDFSLPIGKSLWFVPLWHTLATTGLLVLVGLSALSLLFIVLLSDSIASKFRWIGGTCTAICLWNVIPWVLLLTGSLVVEQSLTQMTKSLPTFVLPLARLLTQPLVTSYVKTTGLLFAILGIGGILFFIASLFIPTTTAAAAPPKTKKAAKK